MQDSSEIANDEGADPTDDIKRQKPGHATMADVIDKDDPHKAEKLTNLGQDADKNGATE